ncbi:MAG: alpha/beta hydrolase [Betaproteobacteria bacterium]|jgi:pimeloyl-ACP methyl ester carboxylesterase
MPFATIRSVQIFYETFGDHGPWLALNAGGRNSHAEMAPLAKQIAQHGFRVLVHDRRNTGASQMLFEGTDGEEEIWADDLYELMSSLGALPAFFAGSSAGARLSMLMRRRHPEAVKGLLLMRITGGDFAAGRLPTMYYLQFTQAAEANGMEGVCNTAPYQERLALNPSNRDYLMSLDPKDYIAQQQFWLSKFLQGPRSPVMGMENSELEQFNLPVLVVPGNDKTHASANGIAAHQLIPGSELFQLPTSDQDVDLIAFPLWHEFYPLLTDRFVQFMRAHA